MAKVAMVNINIKYMPLSNKKKNSFLKGFLQRAKSDVKGAAKTIKSGANLVGVFKDIRGAKRSSKKASRMTGKLQAKIKEEQKTPASLEKQAERNARREGLGVKTPPLRYEGISRMLKKRKIG